MVTFEFMNFYICNCIRWTIIGACGRIGLFVLVRAVESELNCFSLSGGHTCTMRKCIFHFRTFADNCGILYCTKPFWQIFFNLRHTKIIISLRFPLSFLLWSRLGQKYVLNCNISQGPVFDPKVFTIWKLQKTCPLNAIRSSPLSQHILHQMSQS